MNNIPTSVERIEQSLQTLNAPPKLAKADEARKAAQQFEAIFLRMIVKDMRKSATAMTGGGMMGEGVGSDVREGWFDTFMSDHLAASGRVGLAQALYRDWVEAGKIEDPSENADASKASDTDEQSKTADITSITRRLRSIQGQSIDLIQDVGNLNGKGAF